MNKSRRAVPVRVAKGGFLPASNSNGELPPLKNFLQDSKSEFSRNIRTYNTATKAQMNRLLSQAYRDHSSHIEGLNKQQQATYKAMCRIIELQKTRGLEAAKQNREDLVEREVEMERSNEENQMETLGAHVQKTKTQTRNQSPTSCHFSLQLGSLQKLPVDVPAATAKDVGTENSDGSEMVKSAQQGQDNKGMKTALSANAKTEIAAEPDMLPSLPKMGLVSRLQNESSTTEEGGKVKASSLLINTSKKAFFTASLVPRLPAISEAADDSITSKHGVTPSRQMDANYKVSDDGIKPSGNYSDSSRTQSKSRAVSLQAQIQELERRHIQEFFRKQNLITKPLPYQLPLNPSDHTTQQSHERAPSSQNDYTSLSTIGSRSIAKERRRLARMRELHRKAVLDSEILVVYHQKNDGSFAPDDLAYKRKRFLPPSDRKEKQRQDFLKLVENEMENNQERIGEFLDRILPGTKMSRRMSVRRLSQAMAALNKEGTQVSLKVPESQNKKQEVKTFSELAESCAYIRRYVRPAERDHYMPVNTSWRQLH